MNSVSRRIEGRGQWIHVAVLGYSNIAVLEWSVLGVIHFGMSFVSTAFKFHFLSMIVLPSLNSELMSWFEFETHNSSSFFPILFTSLGGEVENPNACIPSYLQQTVLCAQPRHRQVLLLLFSWHIDWFDFCVLWFIIPYFNGGSLKCLNRFKRFLFCFFELCVKH